jgi:hypothetical protein
MLIEARLPVISKIARKYLAVPVTSIPTEQIFRLQVFAYLKFVIIYLHTQWRIHYSFKIKTLFKVYRKQSYKFVLPIYACVPID